MTMGDIREFWLATLFYLIGVVLAYLLTSTTAAAHLHLLLRVFIIIGGGFVIGTGLVFLLYGILKICRRK